MSVIIQEDLKRNKTKLKHDILTIEQLKQLLTHLISFMADTHNSELYGH